MQKRILSIVLVIALLFSGCGLSVDNTKPTDSIGATDVSTAPMDVESTISPTEIPTETTCPSESTEILEDISSVTVVPTESEPIDTQPVETTPVETTPPETTSVATEPTVQKTVSELVNDGVYMLRRSFGFYKGSVDMEKIEVITFSRTAPSSYDECWNANLADTSDIKGYRVGNEVIIVGEYIYANTYSGYMFAAENSYGDALWASLRQINGLELLDMSHCKNMSMMFGAGKFTELKGIGQWDVSSVTDMTMVFAWCTELTSLDIGNWDVSNVRSFAGMFQGHSWAGDMKLQYLDVSKWDTSSAEEMNHVFYGCALLTYIPIENWDVSNVTTFSHMFADCHGLQSLDFSKWQTLSVVSFDAFLNDCHSLTTIDVSGLDTATCKQFSQMFEACTSLHTIIGLDTWDVSNASRAAFEQMFRCCYSLTTLDLSSWHATPDDTAQMFSKCSALQYVDLSNIDMSQCTWVQEMFDGCTVLSEVKWLMEYDFSYVDGYDSMYTGSPLAYIYADSASE